MSSTVTRKRILLSILLFGVVGCCAYADDWPQWRGVNRDGVWNETGIVSRFDTPQLAVKWRAEISGGYSGPTVANNRVYVTDRVTEPSQQERVHCFDAMTGANIWSHAYECEYKKAGYPIGPRASVTVDSGRAYSLGTMGNLFCFDAAMGTVLWKKDLLTEYAIRMPIWGISSSPLIEGNLLIVQIGGADNACMVAFDTVTGKEIWRALEDNASYSAPIIIEQAGQRVLVCWTGNRVVGMDPTNGKVHWEHPMKPWKMVINIATPVFHNNYIFVSCFYDGSLLLKVNPDELTAEKIWRRKGPNERETDSLHCCISTPILQGDYIYGVDSYGELRCLDLKTGDRVWEDLTAVPKERWSNIHMVKNADKIWMFNERGQLIISKLSPQGFHEISRSDLIEPTEGQLSRRGGVCWSHPAYAYKHIYIRNDNEIVCASLAADK